MKKNNFIDSNGVEWKEYIVSFTPFCCDDKEFQFEIWATSDADAENRLYAIKENAHIKNKEVSATGDENV